MVKVATDPGDRRSRLLALTPKGMKLLAEAVPAWERTHQEIQGLLPDGDSNRLRSNLHTLSAGGKLQSASDVVDLLSTRGRRSGLCEYPSRGRGSVLPVSPRCMNTRDVLAQDELRLCFIVHTLLLHR